MFVCGCVCVCIYTYTYIYIYIYIYIYCFYLGQRQSQPSALINYLNYLSIIISSNNALYVCIACDLNTDFSRATSWHIRSLNNFIEHECGSD